MMMKNILVATDFSHDAYNALFYITQLMASRTCTFHILNVFDEQTPLHGASPKLFSGKKMLEQLEIQSKEKLTEARHRIVLENGNQNHQFKIIWREGNLGKNMAQIIETYEVDLVVMGSKGTTGTPEIFLGSNTIKVAKEIEQCPILAVPKQMDYRIPKQIALVTDFKGGCNKKTLAPLLFVASLVDAFINVMHIVEEEKLSPEQESRKKMLELCLGKTTKHYHEVEDYANKADIINTFIENKNIDLLSMVYHKRSFLERLVREPVIKDVNIYATVPLLILQDMD